MQRRAPGGSADGSAPRWTALACVAMWCRTVRSMHFNRTVCGGAESPLGRAVVRDVGVTLPVAPLVEAGLRTRNRASEDEMKWR